MAHISITFKTVLRDNKNVRTKSLNFNLEKSHLCKSCSTLLLLIEMLVEMPTEPKLQTKLNKKNKGIFSLM